MLLCMVGSNVDCWPDLAMGHAEAQQRRLWKNLSGGMQRDCPLLMVAAIVGHSAAVNCSLREARQIGHLT